MSQRLRWLGGLLPWLLLAAAAPAFAQAPSGARLYPPDTELFPRIQAYLDVYDESGGFVHGLQAGDVSLLEDDRPVELSEFTELHPGVQVVFALNPGDSFTIRNSQGASRYDLIAAALADWAKRRLGSTVDDISLLVTGGPARTHFIDPAQVPEALQEYNPAGSNLAPNLDTLLQALDIAADPAQRLGMARTILFITSPLQGDAALGLQDVILRATELGVRIHVWMVASSDDFESSGSAQLRALADGTGGEFLAFSGAEDLPSPEAYLDRLRNLYRLVYESKISSGGTHRLEVRLEGASAPGSGAEVAFDLALQPPDPAFISPVAEIVRHVPPENRSIWQQSSLADLTPDGLPLTILVDFPDGQSRQLASTRLLVDGELVAEHTAPPFDQFVWDISAYTETQQHVLQLEAVDALGLTGRSIETPVQIVVELPQINPLAALAQRWPVLLALAGVLAAAVILLALIVAGKIAPHALRMPAGARLMRRRRKAQTEPEQPGDDTLFKPEAGGRRLGGWVNRLHWPQRRLELQAPSYLVQLSEGEGSSPGAPVSITADEITLGRDKSLAMLVLEDESVEGLHARLLRNPDGTYRLLDEGSAAGTWVNYSRVAPEGTTLKHGDLIHIGRAGFQFRLRDLRQVPKPAIHVEEPAI
jgi:hypothetical protein